MSFSDFLKKGVNTLTGGDFLTNLAANAITSKLVGGDTKDALLFTALQQGLGSEGGKFNFFGTGSKDEEPSRSELSSGINADLQSEIPEIAAAARDQIRSRAKSMASEGISSIEPVSSKPFKQSEGTLGYASMLVDSGILSPDNTLTNLLNSPAGEALATSLMAGLGQRFFGSEEEELGSGMSSRPFGGTGNVSLNMPQRYAQGGMIDNQYFPRRNGGIMPSEGSGQKDDVPAMLMAGEFVLTKDAVKGLGNGDSNKGIAKAYSVMNQLENKAKNYG